MRTRLAYCSVAVSVAVLAFAAPASAAQTTVGYNVKAGTCTKPIAVPANNKPVQVMGTQIQGVFPGTAQVTLLRTTGAQQLLIWSGIDFANGLERSYNNVDNAHIMSLDYGGNVDVRTAPSAHIKVCNATDTSISPAAGYLTFTY